jgi:uridylate kinase
MSKKIVLKIGGSILYDADLNINFPVLEKFKNWYLQHREEYEKIIIVTGGGALSRDIQRKIEGSITEKEYLHNIAMSVTQTNAAIVQGCLEDSNTYIPKRLGDAYEFLAEDKNRTLISGGLKVGWSTDMDAAVFADMLDVDTVYKVSNIDYVYDSDPTNNPNAKPFEDLTWVEYSGLFNIADGDNHEANQNIPIDVMCAQFCLKKGISFFICGGKALTNGSPLEDVLKVGTLIH